MIDALDRQFGSAGFTDTALHVGDEEMARLGVEDWLISRVFAPTARRLAHHWGAAWRYSRFILVCNGLWVASFVSFGTVFSIGISSLLLFGLVGCLGMIEVRLAGMWWRIFSESEVHNDDSGRQYQPGIPQMDPRPLSRPAANRMPCSHLILIDLPFSIYLGWTTVAAILNFTLFLIALGWSSSSTLKADVWAILVLIVALGIFLKMVITSPQKHFGNGAVQWKYLIWVCVNTVIFAKHLRGHGVTRVLTIRELRENGHLNEHFIAKIFSFSGRGLYYFCEDHGDSIATFLHFPFCSRACYFEKPFWVVGDICIYQVVLRVDESDLRIHLFMRLCTPKMVLGFNCSFIDRRSNFIDRRSNFKSCVRGDQRRRKSIALCYTILVFIKVQ